jgi:hypothetical protein
MDIPLAIAGIYNFSQKVMGLRSTCFAFFVSACISYSFIPQRLISLSPQPSFARVSDGKVKIFLSHQPAKSYKAQSLKRKA